MKTLLTSCFAALLLLLGATPSQSQAAPPLAVANFSVEKGLPFSLTIDGQPVPATTPQVHLDNIAPGPHSVEMAFGTALKGRNRGRVRADVWLEEGLETSFVLTQRPGRGWQLRQVGTQALPGYGYEDQPGTYAQPGPAAADLDSTPAAPGGAYSPTAGPPTGYPASPGYPTRPAFPSGPAGYPAPGGYPAAPVANSDIAGLVQALKQCSFDDKRLPIFYQAISRAYLRSDELAQLVRTMTYSESQCQVAEFGYAHLSDPQNFHRVLDALTFSTDASTVLAKLGLSRY
jgi:hypothetical protein